jgi:Cu-Zn family superoxide dismutase
LAVLLLLSAPALAGSIEIPLFEATESGPGKPVGVITVEDTPYGALFTPNLHGLTPGLHGFHVHENPACEPLEKDGKMVPGLAAGGHFDPAGTGRHEGPYGNGHLGDLPPLYADQYGKADLPVLAPRLAVKDIKGRSLMIHAGADNYSDHPAKLGGGGARVACGVVP